MSRSSRSFFVTFLVVALLLSAAPEASNRLALAPGDPAPRLRGLTLDRERWHAEWDKGTFTLVNFWATWCEPCKAEMPALQKLHAANADKGLQVVGMLMDPVKDDELRAFLGPLALTYPIIRPDAYVNKDWGGVVVMPITFLVDRQGKIVRRYVGATPEQVAGLVTDVEAVLDGRPLGTMVLPDQPGFVGDEERLKIKEEQEAKDKPGPAPSGD